MYFCFAMLCILSTFILSKKWIKYRRVFLFTNTAIVIIYIMWRFTVIPTSSLTSFGAGIILMVAELLGLTQFLIFQYLFSRTYRLPKKTLDGFNRNQIPSVDVLICTYNEPIKLVEKTIVASLNMHYPEHKMKIYVCDDGKRKELQTLCQTYGVGYITRIGNEGAKAGNINNALKYIGGDLFAVLDADMPPTEKFLEKTVGYFIEEEVAFVQTPQVYYNQDMYQYNLKKDIPNEQDFFMRDVQEARAAINAVLHVGTNAVFRRSCVDGIGGYPTCSITEDMAVGMLLQSKGYQSVFINEVLVLGLSVTTYSDLVMQRDRWCRGNLQVIKHFNPIFTKGLTWPQRIAYIDGVLYWGSSIQKMIYILAPIMYLITHTLIIESSTQEILGYFIPFLIGQWLIFKTLSPHTRSLQWSHFYEVAMAPHISFSVIRELFALNTKFNVTPKDVVNEKAYFQFKTSLPHIIITILTLVGWGLGTYAVLQGKIAFGAYSINVIWSMYNLIGVVVSIYVAYQKPIYRSVERIKIKEDLVIELRNGKYTYRGYLKDLSERGIGIQCPLAHRMKLGKEMHIKLIDEGRKVILKGKVVRIQQDQVGLQFEDLKPDQMQAIIKIYLRNIGAYYEINKAPIYLEEYRRVQEYQYLSP